MGQVQDTATFIKNAWDAVEEMGGDVPAQNKNLANLMAGIASIPQGPAVPTSLAELKKMVRAGREIVIGTEIPDMYAGNSNPLIVAHNLNDGNNGSYGGAKGVLLVRKYVEPTFQEFNSSSSNVNYDSSTILTFLNNEYLEKCSEELRSIISEVGIPYYNGSTIAYINGKWHLMSGIEVCGTNNSGEGQMWDIWKERTGLVSANNGTNSGRIGKDRNGNTQYWWLRSRGSSSYICGVYINGSISTNDLGPSRSNGVLPACFIGKD